MIDLEAFLQELLIGGAYIEAGCLRVPAGNLDPEKQELLSQYESEILDLLPTYSFEMPLSYGQEALWVVHQNAPNKAAYNTAVVIHLQSIVDKTLLRDIFQKIGQRHTALRTTIAVDDGQLKQVIHATQAICFEEVDCSGQSWEMVMQAVEQAHQRPFDLSEGPLWRVTLVTQAPDRYALLLSFHHIIVDGWSIWMLVDEFLALAGAVSRAVNLPAITGTYPQFVLWQREMLDSHAEHLQAYWQEALGGHLPVLELSTDYARPKVITSQTSSLPFNLSSDLRDQLRAFARREGVSFYTVLLAALQILLGRYQQDAERILVGVPTGGRERKEFAQTFGYFVNMVVVDATLTDVPFTAFLQQVRANLLAAIKHRAYPFPWVVKDLQLERDLSRGPIYQASLVVQRPQKLSQETLRLLKGQQVQLANGLVMQFGGWLQTTGELDLMFDLMEHTTAEGLVGYIRYRSDLFSEPTIERMGQHYQQLLKAVVEDATEEINQLPMLTERERQQILVEWNDTAVDFGEWQAVHTLFEQHAKHTPDAIALVFASLQHNQDKLLTYHELNQRANQLAHHLIELGIGNSLGTNTLVAVAMERSLEMIISVLAVLKAGGAYVPIDPAYPAERIAYMLADSAAPILLTQSHLPFAVESEYETEHVTACPLGIAVDKVQLDTLPTENPQTSIKPEHLAYVIYTSGSTGRPKGVTVAHESLFNLVLDNIQTFDLSPSARVMHAPTFGFDVEVGDLFMTLCSGATLYLPAPGKLIGDFLRDHLSQSQATHVSLTPSALSTLHPEPYPHLQAMIVAGEALPNALAQSWLEFTSVWNAYGPTENTIYTTATLCQVGVKVHIGKPLSNVKTFILDETCNLVPVGVAGELVIGGIQLAGGYLNRPKLTDERFIEHSEFGRLYKTGDLCRWLPDGSIEYIGRTDFQIKLRGYRIELGEIESILLAQDDVREVVVVARAVQEDKRLVAYLVPQGCSAIGDADSEMLRQRLTERLPEYMIPSAFVTLIEMPLTPNGKLDRRALPAPDYSRLTERSSERKHGADAQETYVPPRHPLEQQVAEVWTSLLGVEQIGIDDHFFALGGHSLLATQVISRLRAQLHLDVPLKTLFEAPQLAAFAHAISQMQTSATAVILPAARDGQLPLSFAQQRLWFLDQLEADSAFYNIPMMIRLEGQLDVVALERSIAYLISRHESLRTTFDTIGGQPIQIIHDPTPFTLSLAVVDDAAQAQSRANTEAETPFNLRKGPLLRVQLLKIGKNSHVLLLNMHHIISDGWSIDLFMKELSHAYATYIPTLPELPIQYADFALWQRRYLSGDRLDTLLSFWREHLDGVPALLELPTDRPRPPVHSYRGATYTFHLNTGLTEQLNQLAVKHDTTLFMLLLASFNVLLSRHSNQTDIVVGTPIANRNRAEIEGLIGCFVNTLALRTTVDDNPTFTELLHRVRHNTLAAYEHQDLPFEQLVDELQLQRSLSYSPLFQVMFALQNAEISSFSLLNPEFGPLTATLEPIDLPFAKFDLTLNLIESSKSFDTGPCSDDEPALRGVLEYNTDLFDEETIARMASHFTVLLDSIVADPDQPIFRLPMLTEAESHQIVHEFNQYATYPPTVRDSAEDSNQPQTVHALFELQAERTPNAVALQFDEHEPLTYHELNTRANQLAHYLIECGGGKPLRADTLVAIVMERSPEMVVALLAVLKAGGAYLPIDPSYPQARIRYMLTDSAAPILLTSAACGFLRLRDASSDLESIAPSLFDVECKHVIAVDQLGAQLPTHNPQIEVNPEQLAYVIYTSGSTGKPKGVMIEHQALSHHLVNISTVYGITSQDKVLQFAAFSFDAAQEQIFTALCNGATLLLRPNHVWTATEFEQQVLTQGITVADLPPAYFQQLLNAWLEERTAADFSLPSLRLVCLGGEKVPPEIVRGVQALNMRSTRLLNVYGPTEATITTTYFDLTTYQPKTMPTNLPIGKPLLGRKVYILDDYGQPVPVGVSGELYIGGDSLARGYLNRPDLTAQRFIIKHPDFGRLYKTGDLCRWLPTRNACADAGSIEFIGRTDFQVKIRGFRIELGEIESALLAQDGVREVVVLARAVRGDERLVAYLVGDADIDTLRQQLAQHLPDYMVPSAFVTMNALPLTPNGKVNRRALPAPTYDESASHHVPAETLNETQLVLVWQNVLGVHPIGVEDNFFELGGHSLLATQLVHQMRQPLGQDISLQQLFQTPTIRGLLQALDQKQATTTSFVPLRAAGNRTPLFLIHAVSGVVFPFSSLLPYLSSEQPVYALQARGIYDELPPFESLDALVSATIKEMKHIQPHGPYALSGWSFGGMVAFEIARQLTQQGDDISFLGVMDSYPRTPDEVTNRDIQPPQEELQAFFHLLGDTIGRDYRRLLDDLLVNALEHEHPIDWLLDQMSQQNHRLVLDHAIMRHPSMAKRIWLTMKRNRQLMENYQPQPYEGPITLFSAQESAPEDGTQRWQALTPHPVDTVWVSGEHYTMLNVAHVETLGRELETILQQ